jgi:hypothetical protein
MSEERGLFAGLRPPRPGAGLRERVLSAASRAPVQSPPGWIDRLWESRRVTRAWRLAALLLLGAHVVLLWGETGFSGRGQPLPSTEVEAFEGGPGARLLALREAPRRTDLADVARRWAREGEQGL